MKKDVILIQDSNIRDYNYLVEIGEKIKEIKKICKVLLIYNNGTDWDLIIGVP